MSDSPDGARHPLVLRTVALARQVGRLVAHDASDDDLVTAEQQLNMAFAAIPSELRHAINVADVVLQTAAAHEPGEHPDTCDSCRVYVADWDDLERVATQTQSTAASVLQ